ncbi:nitrate reductase cytochrome c-type subunit; periplasmic nitrate reductase electron transfer subunit [Photobacterium profundum]|jgi:nitrate reductase (cytochrome), electron transfer subunit|uniref:Periplasmic nitrate reductase, electron transfer subunit n=2 Tax=Photobacterium TaxID=657 RepID=Q1Z7G5_9GAMM|nr:MULTISPECIES: nitrate reductase cytochrome c-type subunit [Photobacterium]EAS44494.1 putative periplasmic nitrate reductase,cytochrome c-type protein [Photobacterium profundum 3TCK]PSV48775.1 nitrate reductase cytochrome c-type subunit; periplasmic nitrate reductase electron transfer subunit [Photobacterium indicum]PSV64642.1 nitrate reductase cytochrome c-type subunit; periplasmic nitrate reductase electron transfer subunit [Photobacterium profundum]
MKRLVLAVMTVGMLLAGAVQSAEETSAPATENHKVLDQITMNPGGIGGVESLRGASELETTRPADAFKRYPRDQGTIDSDYVYQPPLIPHTIRNYEVSLNANKCLACHSWKNAKEMGATKISVTHYETREGQVLSDVSPRRYFCQQCHVPQADAKPLVGNDFQRVDALR